MPSSFFLTSIYLITAPGVARVMFGAPSVSCENDVRVWVSRACLICRVCVCVPVYRTKTLVNDKP